MSFVLLNLRCLLNIKINTALAITYKNLELKGSWKWKCRLI